MNIRLTDLHIYPLKSGAALTVPGARVLPEGLRGDRRLMVADGNGQLVTARDFPGLLNIQATLDDGEIILRVPGCLPLVRPWPHLEESLIAAVIWGDRVVAVPVGTEADEWLSCYLKAPVQLLAMGRRTRREIGDSSGRPVSFADAAPILLTNQASLRDLEARSGRPLSMGRFRPNLVVDDGNAFSEDAWKRIRIGEVEFDVLGPCDRCNMILLDPANPLHANDGEPLATLARYRRNDQGLVYFGQLLVPRSEGRLHVGDLVEVIERGPRRKFVRGAVPLERLSSALIPPPPSASAVTALRCVDRIEEARDVTTYRFAAIAPQAVPNHAPGQHMLFQLDIDGEIHRRCFTLSSSPSRPGVIAITVKRNGRFTTALDELMKPGAALEASGPAGNFHLFDAPARKLLFLSAGSGVTPMLSMLRWVADMALPVHIIFHHSERCEADVIARAELAALSFALGKRMELSFRYTGEGAARFTPEDVSLVCPDVGTRQVFACGPPGFLDAVRTGINALEDFDPVNFKTESFGTGGAVLDVPVAGAPYEVRFLRSGAVATGDDGATLLALARRANISVPIGCEAGLCGTCRVRMSAGEWTLAATCADPERRVLSTADKAAGYVLACTTCPRGMVEVEL